MSRFVIPGPHPGLIIPGNIDIYARPVVKNPKGGYSTVDSASSEALRGDGHFPWGSIPDRFDHVEVAFPQVVGNRVVDGRTAWRHCLSTGLHLGIFDNASHATSYLLRLHQEQARYYRAQIAKRQRAARG